MAGRIEVITGPRLSGKTTELFNRLERYLLAGKSYSAFKPDCCEPNNPVNICGVTTVSFESVLYLGFSIETDLIVIDDAQNFGQELTSFCQSARDQGKVILVCGLDMDFNREPFRYMGELMAIADSVTKLTAVCGCGNDAKYTKKISDQYIPCCSDCYKTEQMVLRAKWICPECGAENCYSISRSGGYNCICESCHTKLLIFFEVGLDKTTNEFDGETANQVSNWLNENGYKEASLALDCAFDL